ncbi:hypothetical protein D917_07901 [Trichinella nativa]|uniref:Uncharacterized protein n=1 Tax=Trichinella nativa TaxID=6335 RepID=A0A1Y3EN65_9BILA|nr:hypothetical protein D917_07901 [Trichinella nativa]
MSDLIYQFFLYKLNSLNSILKVYKERTYPALQLLRSHHVNREQKHYLSLLFQKIKMNKSDQSPNDMSDLITLLSHRLKLHNNIIKATNHQCLLFSNAELTVTPFIKLQFKNVLPDIWHNYFERFSLLRHYKFTVFIYSYAMSNLVYYFFMDKLSNLDSMVEGMSEFDNIREVEVRLIQERALILHVLGNLHPNIDDI